MRIKNRISGSVLTEGDTLFFKVTGSGIPLLFIAGGGGDGDLYLPLADELANDYKIITYDRRANARSSMNFPNNFDISQQARDAVAVLHAAGENAAIVFGNSSGGIIALEMASLFPQNTIGIIAHEPPIVEFHPDRCKWRRFFSDCYNAAFKFGGASMAATKFMFGIEVPALQMIKSQMKAMKYLKNEPKLPHEKRISSKLASKFLIEQELIKVTQYQPDISFIKENKQKYILAVGSYAQQHNSFLYKISQSLSELMDKPYVVVSGHHGSFMDDTKAWGDSIRKFISMLPPS